MLSLFRVNHCLLLFYMDKCSIWFKETKHCINKFKIGYMNSPDLNFNKSFSEQVHKCMTTTFGAITQPHIRAILPKNKSRVIALVIFNKTRAYNPKKYLIEISYIIYNNIMNMSVLII